MGKRKMNKVILIGRITKDPELRHTSNDLAFCQFTVAVNRNYRSTTGETVADFINCVAWKNQAENLSKYMHKGNLIGVEGSIQTRSYEDNNGVKKFVVEVLAEKIEFLESKNSQNNQTQTQSTYQKPKQPEQFQKQDDSVKDAFDELKSDFEVSNEDLPF